MNDERILKSSEKDIQSEMAADIKLKAIRRMIDTFSATDQFYLMKAAIKAVIDS